MPYDKNNYKTIFVSSKLHETIKKMAVEAAEKEGLSRIYLPQMIERMVKVYKEQR